jgi:signal transduction histidine kinase
VQTLFKGDNFDVLADRNLMEYSIFNLLNNAFKYSEESGGIILNLTAKSSEVTIEIIDFGIGIPEEDQHKLFNTFFGSTLNCVGTNLNLH